MKKVLCFLVMLFAFISFNSFADVFDVHSEQLATNTASDQSAMDRVGEQRPMASPVTGSSYETDNIDAVDIIRQARVKAIEYSDQVSQAQENGNKELADAYQECSNAMDMIAKGFEEKNNEMIGKGRAAYKSAESKVNQMIGQYNRMQDPQYNFSATENY